MQRSGNGNAIHLELIPESRRQIIRLLKRRGPLPVEEIAEHLDVTVSGARQHLSSLERDGVVTYQRIRQGPGRPRHLYELTERGDALFPGATPSSLNELLGYVRETDPALVERVFSRRAQRRADLIRDRVAGRYAGGAGAGRHGHPRGGRLLPRDRGAGGRRLPHRRAQLPRAGPGGALLLRLLQRGRCS